MGYTAYTFRRRLNGIDIDIVMPDGTIEETVGGVSQNYAGTVDGLGRVDPLYQRFAAVLYPVYRSETPSILI